METKILEHECMTCGKVYWGEDKPQFCPNCNGSMVRVVETDDDQFERLMNALVAVGQAAQEAYRESPNGIINHEARLTAKYKAALREYVDALVSNGITAQIAENLEQIDALQTRITAMEFANDAFFQVIQAQVGRIAELEKSIVYAGRREEYLQSEIRERDE